MLLADNILTPAPLDGLSTASAVRTAGPSLIEALLEEQRDLTAVERFSWRHSAGESSQELRHSQARHYEDLIPLSQPGPGEQFAFRVDLDACSGCKACVAACHQLNGLADEETCAASACWSASDAFPPYHRMP
ncbi:MAG: hypothetical protein QM775_11050 [Pirellulales bacterium]